MSQFRRYMVFGGDNSYERNGGMADFLTDFDALSDAVAFARGYLFGNSMRWVQLYDTADRKVLDWNTVCGQEEK